MKLWLQNLAWQLGVALGLIEPRACNPSRWKTTSNAGASPRGNVAEPVPTLWPPPAALARVPVLVYRSWFLNQATIISRKRSPEKLAKCPPCTVRTGSSRRRARLAA